MGNIKRPSALSWIPPLYLRSKENVRLLLDALEGRPTGARASGLKRKYPGADPIPRPGVGVPVSPDLSAPHYSQLTLSQQSRRSRAPQSRYSKSMGYSGPRFAKRRNKKSTKYPNTYKTESGGTVSGTSDCAYIGHGPAYVTVLRMLCMALYERLRKKHGSDVLTWTDGSGIAGDVVLTRLNGDPTVNQTTDVVTTISLSQNHATVVQNMINYFYNKFRDTEPANTQRNYEALEISLRITDTATVSSLNSVASIDLSRCSIMMKFYSFLNIQNQTLADDGTGDQADDVGANPLHGRSYSGKGNGWRWKRVMFTGTPAKWTATADRDKGHIFIDRSQYDFEMNNFLQRPPDKNMLANVSKIGPAKLQPGQIRGDRLNYSCMISVNNLIYKLKHVLRENTVPGQSAQLFYLFGYSVFAFEKQMRTGGDIKLAYEVDQVYRSKLIERRRDLPALTVVNTDVNYAPLPADP